MYIEENVLDTPYAFKVLVRIKTPPDHGFEVGKVHGRDYLGMSVVEASDSIDDLVARAVLMAL